MLYRLLAASLCIVAFAGACSDEDESTGIDPARSTIAIIQNEGVPADGESNFDIHVTVRDNLKSPMAGKPVFFQVDGMGNAIDQPARTDKKGSTVGHVRSHVAGKKQLAVWAGEGRERVLLGVRSLGFATGNAAAIQALSVPAHIRAGQPFSVKALIVDAGGNVVTTADDMELRIRLLSNEAGARVKGTLNAKPAFGRVTFSDLKIETPAEGLVFEISAPEMESVQTLPFDITPGGVDALVFDMPARDYVDGEELETVTVRAIDKLGNPIAEHHVIRLSLEGPGTLNGHLEKRLIDGKAAFDGLSIDGLGQFRLVAEADGKLVGASPMILVEEDGAWDKVVLLASDISTVEQRGRVTVIVRNDEHYRVQGATVQMSGSEDIRFQPASGKTGPDGSLGIFLSTTLAGDHTVIATVGEDTAETTVSFLAGKAAADRSTIVFSKEEYTLHETAEVVVRIVDRFENPVAGASYRLANADRTSEALTISPDPNFVTDVNGEATLEITSSAAGVFRVGVYVGNASAAFKSSGSLTFVDDGSEPDDSIEDPVP